MHSDYNPKKINTEGIELFDHLRELINYLARNNHDVWALQRIEDGWTWGPNRCDINKHHPCLISYENLPLSEKRYDIILAEEIVKSIISLGYKLKKQDSYML